jgi:hypothetical protein
MTDNLKATIREAGGIVHGDGNIFFTNAEQFLAAAGEAVAGAIVARGQGDTVTVSREAYEETVATMTKARDLLRTFYGKGATVKIGTLYSHANSAAWGISNALKLLQSPASPDAGAGVAQCPNCKGTRTPHALDPARRGRCECVEGAPASAPEAPEQQGEYPPLPEDLLFNTATNVTYYRADQMHAYVDADRKERQLAACNFCLNEAAEARAALASPDLRSKLNAAANYIDTLGGDSKTYRAALAQAAPATGKVGAVVDMVLHCPKCGLQHVDGDESKELSIGGTLESGTVRVGWDNPPHRSHLCHGCGHIWRPADVPTNGVQAVKTTGNADSPIATPAPTVQAETGEAQAAINAIAALTPVELKDFPYAGRFRCQQCRFEWGGDLGTEGHAVNCAYAIATSVPHALTAVQADKGGA